MAGRIKIEEPRCKGCQLCTTACPKKLVSMAHYFNALGYRPSRFADADRQCTGCMLCAIICPEAAITVWRGDAPAAV
jgi:2-oxoglutarate ferredoxin oxidoreductase subunit delta